MSSLSTAAAPARADRPAPLVGRVAELATCDALLAAAARRGGALLLRGGPGVGKSTLLKAARDRAEDRGLRVLWTAGVEAETAFPYSALQRLLSPLLLDPADAPASHDGVLRAAFGQSGAAAGTVALVAEAAVELVALRAADRPVALLVDDVDRLDRASAAVIGAVAGRPRRGIVLLATGRDLQPAVLQSGLTELRVLGLGARESERLLAARAPGLSRAQRARILRHADGNPLALVELPRALDRADGDAAAAGDATAGALALPARLGRVFATRAEKLPEATRAALLAAALEPSATPSEALAVAAALTCGQAAGVSHALAPAVLAGLVDADPHAVTFLHPLVRSAIAQTASPARRRSVHAALAELLGNPDRRLWHRARAALGPDAALARALDAAAERAARAGAPDAALDLLERAAALSVTSGARLPRLVRAAEIAADVGRPDEARRVLAGAEAADLPRALHARVRLLGVLLDDAGPAGADVDRELIELGEEAARDGDAALALALLGHVALRCDRASPGDAVGRALVAAALRVPAAVHDPRVTAILALAAPVAEAATIARRLAAVPAGPSSAERDRLLGVAAHAIGDYEQAAPLLDRALAGLRDQGRLPVLARTLVARAWVHVALGEWDAATTVAAEALRVATETDQPAQAAAAHVVRALIAGSGGDAEAQAAAEADADALLREHGTTGHRALLQVARGTAAAVSGRYEDAYSAMAELFDPGAPRYDPRNTYMLVPYFAIVAMRSDRREQAVTRFAALTATALARTAPGLRTALAHSAALLAGADGEERYAAALADPALTRPFDVARLRFAYGMWLRRHRRVSESRAALSIALELFVALGNAPFAERARLELRAAGANARPGQAAWHELSPQETEIARLVAEGLTNREIGERLQVSPRTVASHLHRTFPKLGVTSRTQVARALAELGAHG